MNEPNVIWLVNPKVGSSRFTTSRLWSSVGSRPLKERRIAYKHSLSCRQPGKKELYSHRCWFLAAFRRIDQHKA